MWDEEKNQALTRWWWEEVWIKGNVAAMDEFMAPNYVDHPGLPGLPPGPEGMKQALSSYRTAAPELQATLDDIFAAGDRVALRWSARVTHLGEWLGLPPTGHHFTMSGISIYRLAEGKAVEGWNSIEVNPTEEEQRWLTEGGGWPGRSGEHPRHRGRSVSPVLGGPNPQPYLALPGCRGPGAGTHRAGVARRSPDPTGTPSRGDTRTGRLAAGNLLRAG